MAGFCYTKCYMTKTRISSIIGLILVVVGVVVVILLAIMEPSNQRDWLAVHAVLPTMTRMGDEITVHNLRSFRYRSEVDYDIAYRDQILNLTDVQGVDFVVEPFAELAAFAHTMVVFRIKNNDNIVISIEARREQGEDWDAKLGLLNQYELMYIVADELDAVYLRSNIRRDNVHLYQTIATPDQAQRLFLAMMNRANQLAERPEFYNTLTNNCTTRLVDDVNIIATKPIKFSWRYALPGYADTLAYDLGLLGVKSSFAELEQSTLINPKVDENNLAEFSAMIRR